MFVVSPGSPSSICAQCVARCRADATRSRALRSPSSSVRLWSARTASPPPTGELLSLIRPTTRVYRHPHGSRPVVPRSRARKAYHAQLMVLMRRARPAPIACRSGRSSQGRVELSISVNRTVTVAKAAAWPRAIDSRHGAATTTGRFSTVCGLPFGAVGPSGRCR